MPSCSMGIPIMLGAPLRASVVRSRVMGSRGRVLLSGMMIGGKELKVGMATSAASAGLA